MFFLGHGVCFEVSIRISRWNVPALSGALSERYMRYDAIKFEDAENLASVCLVYSA